MTNEPLVSVVVTTKNNHATLPACLESISRQTYPNIELIVVDNFSTDDTRQIAKRYTPHVFKKGPERCTQRNYAAQQAKGIYIAIIDSDMELAPEVIADCVKAHAVSGVAGIIIPEESFGQGFWAQCKRLERSFYVGVDYIEAARFFKRKLFQRVGGYDEALVSGEDWDLSQRVQAQGKLARITSFIRHNEGHISLLKTIRKKYYYAQKFARYTQKYDGQSTTKQQISVVGRFKLFLSQPKKLFHNPVLGIGMLFMKLCEFGFGAAGYAQAKWIKT